MKSRMNLLWLAVVIMLLGAGLAPQVQAGTIYVSPSGTNDAANRYNTWDGAAQSINEAVGIAAASDEVVVTNGAYPVSTNLYVTNFTVRSVNGPGVTTVYAPRLPTNFPIFRVAHSNAFVTGFGITNGFWNLSNDSGGSVHLTAGTVSNCWIYNTPFVGGTQAGAVYNNGGLLTACIVSNCVPRTWALRMYSGVVENCTLTKNNNPYDSDAPVDIYGGTIRRCRIVRNSAGSSGSGGVQMTAGRMENCLIYGNVTSSSGKPGGMELTGGTVLNCTIASNVNASTASVGSGLARGGTGSLTNCVVYGNSGASGINYSGSASASWYSCAPELTPGSQGNVNGDPRFINLATGDCHLNFGSSAVNSGTNIGITIDLDGTNRDAQCDMGAYERVPPGGPLAAAFSGLPLTGIGAVTSVFTAVMEGTDTNVTWWGWDFNNDGTFETSGAGLQTVTNIFGPGRYSVSLLASNAVPEAARWTNLNYVTVYSTTPHVYVSTNGSSTFPYDEWGKATTNLNDAMSSVYNRGGFTVHVSNGVYGLNTGITLSTNLLVVGEDGASRTIIYRTGTPASPMFTLSHTGAVLTGFTITNAASGIESTPDAISLADGTVSNVVITRCNGLLGSGSERGTVLVSGGLMTGCVISNNTPRRWWFKQTGGLVEDTFISDNTVTYDNYPTLLNGGTNRRCRIIRNFGNGGAGGAWVSGGYVENCLIWSNRTAVATYPGGVLVDNGRLVNCTIAGNVALATSPAGGVNRTGGTLTNCVVYGNYGPSAQFSGTATAAAYSCAPELTSGTSNITSNPLFKNLAAGDCQLNFGSPCIDTGTNLVGVTNDLLLAVRPQNGNALGGAETDMGCYEARDPTTGPLTASFTGTPISGFTPLQVVFTASFIGANTNVTWYGWDFNNDGTLDQSGADLRVVTNTYGNQGTYTVVLQATNAINEFAAATNTAYITAVNEFIYVATNGTHLSPFSSWGTAATNLNAAVAIATNTQTVLVSNGVYAVSTNVALSLGVTVRSLNGPSVTTVYRQQTTPTYFAIFNLSHANAMVSGFTITNGWWDAMGVGGAIHISAGTVSNCVMTLCNRVGGSSYDNGVLYMSGGLVTGCTISNNATRSWGIHVGGGVLEDSLVSTFSSHNDDAPVRFQGGTIRRCRITGNTPSGGQAGAVNMSGANCLLENCLIYGNKADGASVGAVKATAGRMIHCTVASNKCSTTPTVSGVAQSGSSTLTNCIIYGNQTNGAQFSGTATAAAYSCAPELTSGTSNITSNPLFKNLTAGDCRLNSGSPCIDTGTNLVSVTNDLLLAVRPQDGDNAGATNVDMGCYEMRDPSVGAFTIEFTGTPTYGFLPMQVVFTATLMGADTNITWYGWDFDNNGTWDLSGPGLRVVTNTYNTPSTYTVMVQATNSSDTMASYTNLNYLTAVYPYVYVATNGGHVTPFTSWSNAATNLNAAVAIATNGQTVLVSNGVYAVTNQLVVNSFTLRSVNGPANTTIYRHSAYDTRMLALAHASAWVSGFTLTNAQANIYGCGMAIELSAGTVTNCVVTKCPGSTSLQAGIVKITGGLMTHSVISNNQSRSWVTEVSSSGVLQDSVVYGNNAPYDPSPLRVYGSGVARRCRILANYTGGGSLPTVDLGGTLENCLLWGNTVGPAVSMGSGATMVNCTVASNSASAGAAAGGVNRSGGALTNCIVYGNLVAGVANNYGGAGSAAWYSCAPELTAGSQGNLNSDPKFVNLGAGNCQLKLGSPCVNSGTNLPGIYVDLDGVSRDANTDIGALERVSGTGPLEVSFVASPLSGIGSVTSVFTMVAEGNNTTIIWYGWDFDNNGTFDLSGTGLGVVTNVFAPGRHSVSVLASNSILETASATNLEYVVVKSAGNDVYVATNGGAVFPYDTWPKAATNLYDAVMNATHGGSTVWVSNGLYWVNGGLTLATNVAVRSVNGPAGTLVARNSAAGTGFPIFYLSHTNALLAGLTLTNGCWGVQSGAGGAVTMTAGTVSNCVMVGTVADSYNNGVLGLWGGLVTGCVISNNTPRSFTVYVTAGVMEDTIVTRTTAGHDAAPVVIGYGPSAGTVRRCQIVNNTPPGSIAGAVQIHGSGRMENCLVYGNKAQNSPYGAVLIGGGGWETAGGTIVNCTVASNSTVTGASGVTMQGGGTMTNCIVYGNDGAFANYSGAASAAAHSCAPELTHGSQNNITNNPLFVDLAAGNCRLHETSPCINVGTNLPYLIGTVDLDGRQRIRTIIDMGAYESVPPGSTFRFR